VGGFGFPFIFVGAMCLLAAAYLALYLHERPRPVGRPVGRVPIVEGSFAELGADSPELAARASRSLDAEESAAAPRAPWGAFLNRPFAVALALNFGLYCSVGTYEVVWSLFLERLGASLAFIGLTFSLFGIPVLLLAPFAGRAVDRLGGLRFAFAGSLVLTCCGLAYSVASEPLMPAAVVLVESVANAFLGPALFAILATGTPRGRTATAQGLFGSVGTVGFIVSPTVAGALFAADVRYPFWFFAAASAASVVVAGLLALERLPALRSPALGGSSRS
jgi:MFS family permease